MWRTTVFELEHLDPRKQISYQDKKMFESWLHLKMTLVNANDIEIMQSK